MISSVMSSWALATWDHFAWPFSVLLWTLESRTGQRDGVKARTLSTKTKSQTANTFSLAWKLEQRKFEDYWCAPLAAPPLSIIVLYSIAQHNRNDMICFAWSSGLLPRLRSKHGWPEIKAISSKSPLQSTLRKFGPPNPSIFSLCPSALAADLGIDMYQRYQRWVPRREVLCDAARGSYPLSNLRLRPGDIPTLKPTSFSIMLSFDPTRACQQRQKNNLKDMSWMVLIDGI